ncbi:MAG: arginyl-tRNA synthetase [Candidatus Parcubacteria bacterium]|jgi:arginyl-tRNA synthetase|nr:arginyl-tRNA synthetase [Candidatus Parcubacteria bacterium]
MKDTLVEKLVHIADMLGLDRETVRLTYPENHEHGEFSSNIALANAKKSGLRPHELAERIVTEFKKNIPEFVASVEIAGPGFINFKIKDRALSEEIVRLARLGADLGRSGGEAGRKIMVEYTDPNPFKVFHIGHLMANAIGESISRLVEFSGANVLRANWQGDVGPHVAKAVWAARLVKDRSDGRNLDAALWGKAYAAGARAYETDTTAKAEIEEINRKIYDRSDPAINALYDQGRQTSLDAFEGMYKRLGTKFDHYFFEGAEGREGEEIVRAHLDGGIFEKSEGAIVFKGERFGLHTRVFITSAGLPTYETKELGLNREKFKLYPDLAQSIIVTGNEQSDYFKVLLKVMELIYPKITEKTKHIAHGILRFASGKMSSRAGNVIAAETLIDEIKSLVEKKTAGRAFKQAEAAEIVDSIAVGAIKYAILRQAIGSDVIFDSATSISFEGDSGPYLQYAAVRANSVLEKAAAEGITVGPEGGLEFPNTVSPLEKLLSRFPDLVMRARSEYAPQIMANYLTVLAGKFNSFYASQVIVDGQNKLSPYYLLVTKTFLAAMRNGLWLLGIGVPKKM